jgi:hypothetical protein
LPRIEDCNIFTGGGLAGCIEVLNQQISFKNVLTKYLIGFAFATSALGATIIWLRK